MSSWQGSWAALKEENVGRDSAGIVASLSGGAGRSAQWVCWGGVVGEHGSLNPQKQGSSSSLPVADPPPLYASTAASYLEGTWRGCPAHPRCQLKSGYLPKLEGSGGYPHLIPQYLQPALCCCPPSLHSPRSSLQQKQGGKARQSPVRSSPMQSSTMLSSQSNQDVSWVVSPIGVSEQVVSLLQPPSCSPRQSRYWFLPVTIYQESVSS